MISSSLQVINAGAGTLTQRHAGLNRNNRPKSRVGINTQERPVVARLVILACRGCSLSCTGGAKAPVDPSAPSPKMAGATRAARFVISSALDSCNESADCFVVDCFSSHYQA